MRLTRFSVGLAAVALSGAAVVAATPGGVIAARQDNYKQIGRANKAINDELRKSAPAMAVIQANAATLDTLAPRLTSWFPRGSGPESGVKTAALPVIWQRIPEFRADAANFATAAHNLRGAAASGDVNRVRAATAALGGTCRTCHETFRAKD
jgi:cytochrome c556